MALEAVQAQAGQRSIESTRVYLHLTKDWLAEEYHRAAMLIERTRPRGRDDRRAGGDGLMASPASADLPASGRRSWAG